MRSSGGVFLSEVVGSDRIIVVSWLVHIRRCCHLVIMPPLGSIVTAESRGSCLEGAYKQSKSLSIVPLHRKEDDDDNYCRAPPFIFSPA